MGRHVPLSCSLHPDHHPRRLLPTVNHGESLQLTHHPGLAVAGTHSHESAAAAAHEAVPRPSWQEVRGGPRDDNELAGIGPTLPIPQWPGA